MKSGLFVCLRDAVQPGAKGVQGFPQAVPVVGWGQFIQTGEDAPQLPGDGGLFGSGTSPLCLGTAALLGSLPQALGVPGLGGGALGPLFSQPAGALASAFQDLPPQDGNLPGCLHSHPKGRAGFFKNLDGNLVANGEVFARFQLQREHGTSFPAHPCAIQIGNVYVSEMFFSPKNFSFPS